MERYDIFWTKTDYKPEHQSIADRNFHGCATFTKKGLNAKATQIKWHLQKVTL